MKPVNESANLINHRTSDTYSQWNQPMESTTRTSQLHAPPQSQPQKQTMESANETYQWNQPREPNHMTNFTYTANHMTNRRVGLDRGPNMHHIIQPHDSSMHSWMNSCCTCLLSHHSAMVFHHSNCSVHSKLPMRDMISFHGSYIESRHVHVLLHDASFMRSVPIAKYASHHVPI